MRSVRMRFVDIHTTDFDTRVKVEDIIELRLSKREYVESLDESDMSLSGSFYVVMGGASVFVDIYVSFLDICCNDRSGLIIVFFGR